MAGNVPYKYDDKTLEKAKSDIYALYNVGLSVELTLLETQAIILFGAAAEFVGDGADLLYDVYDAVVRRSTITIQTMTVRGWYHTPSSFILQGNLLLSAYEENKDCITKKEITHHLPGYLLLFIFRRWEPAP